MHELFPVFAGVVSALVVVRLATFRLRAAAIAVLSPVFGFIASLISGELFVNWAYLVLDTALVLTSTVVSLTIIALWRRQLGRLR